jgi:hypothetical protein
MGLSLMGCSSSSSKNDNTIPAPLGFVQILSTFPEHDATNLPLDTHLEITFDQKIDAYSAIPENFEIYSTEGAKVGGTKLVSTKFVPDPRDSRQMVSQIRVSLQDRFLSPNMRYIFTWGEPKEGIENADAYGVMNLFGDRLRAGAIAFTTGNSYSPLRSDRFDIVSVSPGRVMSRGTSFNFSGKLKDIFDRGSTEAFFTASKDTPIRITFNKAIGRVAGIDPVTGPILPEIPPTSIESFPIMMVGLFDTQTEFDTLFASLLNQNQSSWNTFRTSYLQRLSGSVRTVNSRKTLVFELDNDCPSQRICEYPDTTAQAVIVMLRGLRSHITNEKIGGEERWEDFVTTGFIHFSGFSTQSPLQFVWDYLPNSSQNAANSQGGE